MKWRSKGLGSSDAAILLGWSPWKTIEELYLEKTGVKEQEFNFFQKAAMARGRSLEPMIREWYEKREGLKYPAETKEHQVFKFLRASCDGINHQTKRLIEIKTANKQDHEHAKNGIVPTKYYPQVQWLMMLWDYKECDYVSLGSDKTFELVRVFQDIETQDELTKRAIFFWNHITTKSKPLPMDWPIWERKEKAITMRKI